MMEKNIGGNTKIKNVFHGFRLKHRKKKTRNTHKFSVGGCPFADDTFEHSLDIRRMQSQQCFGFKTTMFPLKQVLLLNTLQYQWN